MAENDSGSGALEFRDYASTVWKHRWIIVVTVVFALGVAWALTALQTPVYEATADIIIQPSGTQQILNSSPQDAQDAARNVANETAVLESKVVENAANRKLGHQPDVSISSNANSDVVSVSARSTNARRAAIDANAYASAYVSLRRQQNIDELVQAGQQIQAKITEIDGRLPGLAAGSPAATTAAQQRAFLQEQLDQLQVSANLNQVGGARILARADVPDSPASPQPLFNAAIALVLGVIVGVSLAFLRQYLDDSVASREDLERATGELPVLAQVPRISGWRDRQKPMVVTLEAPSTSAAEAYRSLRTSIQYLSVDRERDSIQVTSARIGEGKTTTLANLAVAFAGGTRCHHRLLRSSPPASARVLRSVQQGRLHFGHARRAVRTRCTSTGSWRGEPHSPFGWSASAESVGAPLSSARAREVMASIVRTCDLVLVDSPPVLPVSDALIVSGMVDATLLVANAKSSSRRAMHRTVEMLRQVDAPLVGTVLNNADGVESYGSYEYQPTTRSTNGSNGHGESWLERRKATRADRI